MITAADAKLIYVEGRGLRYVETGGTTYHVPREAQVTGVPGRNEPVRSAAGYLRVNPDGYTHLVTIGSQVYRFRQSDSTPYGPNAYRQSVAEARGVLFSG